MTDSAETKEPKAVENPHVAALNEACGPVESSTFRGQQRVIVPAEKSLDALSLLKASGFDLLVDISCVDYLEYRGAKHRYGLIYLLASTSSNQRLTVRVFVDDPEPTGHPDLRRLVMPEEFTAHPLRKDYPLQGRGERHNFPVITRDHS